MPDQDESGELNYIRDRLRALRAASGLTQRGLGDRLGLTNGTISMIESATRDTTSATVERWVRECGGTITIRLPSDDPETQVVVEHLDDEGRKLIRHLVTVWPRLNGQVRGALVMMLGALSQPQP
jgi:transcriptional regulator with XRE-family HTH domain